MKKQKSSRAISVTYDSHNLELVVLCEDGTLWKRYFTNQTGWSWDKISHFEHGVEDEEKKYRETGI